MIEVRGNIKKKDIEPTQSNVCFHRIPYFNLSCIFYCPWLIFDRNRILLTELEKYFTLIKPTSFASFKPWKTHCFQFRPNVPGGPWGPWGPGKPCLPGWPWIPWSPCGPCDPGDPGGPAEPFCPADPLYPWGPGGLGFQDFLGRLCLPLDPCLLLASPAFPEYPRDQAYLAFLAFLVSKSNSFDHNFHMVALIGCTTWIDKKYLIRILNYRKL